MRRTLKALWRWCRWNRHVQVPEQYPGRWQKRRGPAQYYGIRGKDRLLAEVCQHAEKAWRYWLSRRSQTGTSTGDKIERGRAPFPFPAPRILPNL